MPEPNATTVEPSHESATETTQQSTSIFDELDAEEQSSTEQAAEEPETAEAETVDGTDESDDPNWLPSEQLRVFPPDVVAKYAKRFGYTPEEIAADPRLANALSKMINSDIEIANRKQAEEEAEGAEEETEEEQTEPTQKLEPAEAWAQMETTLNTIVDKVTDPVVAKAFVSRLAKADAIKDPDERAVAVAKTFTFGLANALRDLLPMYLNDGNWLQNQIKGYIEQSLPGLSDSHFNSSLTSTVESVRSSNPQFAKMPKFGTTEWAAAEQRGAELAPGMETAKFHYPIGHPKAGQELPRMEQFAKKTELLFRLLTNQPGAVAQAEKAIETGKKVERDNAQRKTNAKLGAGQSKGLVQKSTGNDDLFGAPGEIALSGKLIGKQS
jgi:hypothetical protein